MAILPYNPTEIQSYLTSLGHVEAGGCTEIRILPKENYLVINGKREYLGNTVAGYYTDYAKAAHDIAPYDGKAAIYATLNPCDLKLMRRSHNKLTFKVKATAKDEDILSILWFPFDVDPVRPADTPSSDNELALALACRDRIISEVFEPLDVPVIRGMSGNGGHGLIPLIGYSNTPETQAKMKRLLDWLSETFSDDTVSVDRTVGNPSRVWKIYGTLAVKGDNTPEAPHRRATIELPETVECFDLFAIMDQIVPSSFQSTATSKTKPKASTASDGEYPILDVDRYLSHHRIEAKRRDKGSDVVWRMDCPFNSDHKNDAQLRQEANGRMGFACPHNSCKGRNWQDFREMFDPTGFFDGGKPPKAKPKANPPNRSESNPVADEGNGASQDSPVTAVLVQAVPSEPSEESQKTLKGPPFPASAWRGIFDFYRRAVQGKNEVCDAYHFAMLKSVAGIIIGRTAYLYTGRYLYPNFYTCLIGTTGLSRKTTALDMGRRLLEDTDPNVISFSGLATPEGLLNQLQIPKPSDDAEGTEDSSIGLFMQARIDATSTYEGFRALIGLSEYAALLKKSKKSASDGLIQLLTEAYDCPLSLENPTRYAPLKAVKPCVSLVALSTYEWLEESLDLADIRGGFANRFCYYLHELTRPIPHPSEPDMLYRNDVVKHLHDIRTCLQKKHVRFDFDPETSTFVDGWYHENWYAIATERNELVRDAMQRLDTNARKLSLLYAILENEETDCQIHLDQFQAAVDVATYWKESTIAIFGSFTTDTQAKNENKLVERLKQRPRTKRQLQQSVGGLMSAKAFNEALSALIQAERVLEVKGILGLS